MALAAFMSAGVVSLLASATARRVGLRLGFVDLPDGDLKSHERVVVPLGGIGVLAGVLVGLFIAGRTDWGVVMGLVVVWTVGLVDDRVGLGPRLRLAAVAIAGLLLVIGSPLVAWPSPLALFWVVVVVVVVNAINLFDGLDGLVASAAIPAAVNLALYSAVAGHGGTLSHLAVAGAVIGFAFFNWPPAKLFLGDNGAYVVAVSLTWLAMASSAGGIASGLVTASLIGIPLLDLAHTIFRRVATGKPMFVGDRDHTYDLLFRRGWRQRSIAGATMALQLTWGACVLVVAALWGDTQAVLAAVVLGVGSLVFARVSSDTVEL